MTELWITIAFVAIVATFCLFFSLRSLSKARLIEDTPTSKISTAAQGYVELIGSAEPDQEMLLAPLSLTRCLWYRFRVERYDTSGKHASWRLVRSGTSERSFFLRDDSGKCHIHPEGADVRPRQNRCWYGNLETPVQGAELASEILFNSAKKYRYTESLICQGDLLYALGDFKTIPAEPMDVQVHTKATEIITQWKTHKSYLRSQGDAAGEVSQTEWQRVKQEAKKEAYEFVMANYDSEPAHILFNPQSDRRHFILASKNPLKLARNYRLRGLAALAGFLLMVALLFHLVRDIFF